MKHLLTLSLLALTACASKPAKICAEGESENCRKPLATNATQAKPNALANFFHGIGDALATKEDKPAIREAAPAAPPVDEPKNDAAQAPIIAPEPEAKETN